MDAKVFAEVDTEALDEIVVTLDPSIGDILVRLKREEPKGIAEELAKGADLKALHVARIAFFRTALDKVDYCLSRIAKAREEEKCEISGYDENLIGKAEEMFRSLKPQDMINRKCKIKLSNDITDITLFACGGADRFPIGMMRANGTPNGSRGAFGTLSSEAIDCIRRLTHLIERNEENDENAVDERNYTTDNKDTDSITEKAAESVSDKSANSDSDGEENVWEIRSIAEMALELEERGLCAELVAYSPETLGKATLRDANEKESGVTLDEYNVNAAASESTRRETEPRVNPGIVNMRSSKDIGEITENEVNPPFILINDVAMETADEPVNTYRAIDDDTEEMTEAPLGPVVPCVGKRHSVDGGDSRESSGNRDNRNANNTRWGFTRANEEHPQNARVPPADTLPPGTQDDHTQSPAIKVTVSVGEISTVIDLSDYTSMASRKNRTMANHEGRPREKVKQSDGCKECDYRFDAMARRVSNLEEEMVDNMRKLRLENRDLLNELQEVKKKLKVVSAQRPAERARSVDPERAPKRSVPAAVFVETTRESEHPYAVQQTEPRRRIVSFDEAPRWRGARPKTSNSKGEGRGNGRATTALPKPQREGGRKPADNKPKPSESNERKNPIREWIHSVKQGGKADDGNAPNQENVIEVPRSPSWADYVDDDEIESSGTMTPDTRRSSDAESTHTVSPGGAAAPPDTQHTTDDERYALPPSGQVNERRARRLEQDMRRERGDDRYGSGALKTRGKMVTNGINANNGNVQRRGKSMNDAKKDEQPKSRPGNKGNSGNPQTRRVVTNSGWKTVQSKKRKYNNVSPKLSFPLKGAASTTVREVYLQGLEVSESERDEDIISSVRTYCLERGITPVYIRIIPVRYDFTRTGCKLTIKECDYERVIREEFWPDLIRVRDWTPRPRDNREDDGGAFNASDDEQ